MVWGGVGGVGGGGLREGGLGGWLGGGGRQRAAWWGDAAGRLGALYHLGVVALNDTRKEREGEGEGTSGVWRDRTHMDLSRCGRGDCLSLPWAADAL